MNSAALMADGHHARTDNSPSLAAVIRDVEMWLEFPLVDPISGLPTTVAESGRPRWAAPKANESTKRLQQRVIS